MKVKYSAKWFFSWLQRDQLPFMKRIVMKSSYSGELNSNSLVCNINIFWTSSFTVVTKSFMFCLRSSFSIKSLFVYCQFLSQFVLESCYKWSESTFWYHCCFKNNYFPFCSKVSHFHHSLNICYSLKFFIFFQFFGVTEASTWYF